MIACVDAAGIGLGVLAASVGVFLVCFAIDTMRDR